MKKILLGTTTLISAACLTAAAAAETPKVTLGGFSNFQAGWTDNDAGEIEDEDDQSIAFRNDNEISVHVDGKTDGGLAYGAVIDLEGDISGDNDTNHAASVSTINQGASTRTFTYLEGGWGRVELGGNKSAAATMRVDASTIAVATGGINGDWRHFIEPNGTTAVPGSIQLYLTTSKLQIEHGGVDFVGDESTYNITKATYYTPRFSGFQAGVSYSPDMDNIGQLAQRIDGGQDGYTNIWEAALGYEGRWSGVRFAASATGNWASADVADDDIEGWNIGALVGWNAFSIAASYGDWGEGAFTVGGVGPAPGSLITDGRDGAEANYWTLGAAYDAGAIGLSATYIDSEYEDATAANDFSNLVLGADYKLAPGLTTYAEVAFYDFDAEDPDAQSDGTTFLVGTQVAY